MEGADAIDPDLLELEKLYRSGLRSLGLVWNRVYIFGHGVPFAWPRSPDTGPGLTPPGKDLVRACNRLGVMIDVSHLNEQGFWDVARLSSAPLVATHACVHAICPSTRNLTDRQLDAIGEFDGIVGVSFSVNDVRPDADLNADTPLHMLTHHFHYLANRIGIDRVGIGSDFDGATIPAAIKDASGLPKLIAALQASGFGEGDPRCERLPSTTGCGSFGSLAAISLAARSVWGQEFACQAPLGTAEVPPIPDGIAAVPRTVSSCHQSAMASSSSTRGPPPTGNTMYCLLPDM